MRYLRTLLALIVVTSALAVPARALASEPVFVGALGQGDEIFWDGYIAESHFFPEDPDSGCAAGLPGCFHYQIDVTDSADLLRVAVDRPDKNDHVWVKIFDPSGAEVARSHHWLFWTQEFYLEAPDLGLWTVRIAVNEGVDAFFRARAQLTDRSESHGRKLLAPDLRMTPPFEFGFRGCVDQYLCLDPGIPGQAAAASCLADEVAEHEARRCLRFSVGTENAGDGPLDLYHVPAEGGVGPGSTFQRLHYADGTTTTLEIAPFEYHKTHGHYHHPTIGTLELFKVDHSEVGPPFNQDSRTMELVGDGPKMGFCLGDTYIYDWHHFDQAVSDNNHFGPERCEGTPLDGISMNLNTGWSDFYSWRLSGNYVEFGVNSDGYYVVRTTTDVADTLLESDETNNASYAFMSITGNEVEVIERGYGLSPWDPHKRIVEDILSPTQI